MQLNRVNSVTTTRRNGSEQTWIKAEKIERIGEAEEMQEQQQ